MTRHSFEEFYAPFVGPQRVLVREAPIAIVCNGSTIGVMMASPSDLEDFAVGFAIAEGVIRDLSDVKEFEVAEHQTGTEVRLWLSKEAGSRAAARQRALIGPVGCGLCGIDSLAKVDRNLPRLPDGKLKLTLKDVCAAPDLLRARQPEHDRTRACHAAGFFIASKGLILSREDVGRHNALDKLAGALARRGVVPSSGVVVLTSRISTEMVQKAVSIGVPVVVAVSAATDFAVRLANKANLTLLARVQKNRCEILSGAHRVQS